jgi:2-octaprenyl-6-methoxyphenol hydroxylase
VEKIAYPLKTMRIIDGTQRLIRAPQTDFTATEIGRTAFGYNIENKLMANIIEAKLAQSNHLTLYKTSVKNVAIEADCPSLLTDTNGTQITADFVIAADGRHSVVRDNLNIGERKWNYPQFALVGNFKHTLPNNDTSTEFHTETGPTTLVPLGTNRSSLVCVVDAMGAENLQSLSLNDLNRTLEQKMHSILGKISLETSLKSFPLSGMVAKRFALGPVMLTGEAAHAFPPIGAQGLNLGLRDIDAAIQLISKADFKEPNSIGEQYHRLRSSDIMTRTASVDMLNRSLLSDFLPVQAGRSLGLYALNKIGPLRRLMMREGMTPGSGAKDGNLNPIEQIADLFKNSKPGNPST